ncbi:MAG: hypothetical protein LC800_17610 [Acidobacteria bacterium]|nr:hypothetical protein [Acidobacteriota bacterium]
MTATGFPGARPRAASLTLLLAALLLAAPATPAAPAESRARRGGSARAQRGESDPAFGSYPAADRFAGTPAPVRLRTRRDRVFRTRLREDSRAGPNFAGRYTVVYWGCGTGCAQAAVVDAVTGLVYWPPLDYVDIPDPDGAEYGPGYRLDSKLLVLTRSRYDAEASYTAYFYVFDRNRFRLVRRAERKRRPIETQDSQGSDPPHDNHR